MYCEYSTPKKVRAPFGDNLEFPESKESKFPADSTFALNANGLMLKIEALLALFTQDIVFTDDGGIRLLQFKKQFTGLEILTKYYDAQSVSVG